LTNRGALPGTGKHFLAVIGHDFPPPKNAAIQQVLNQNKEVLFHHSTGVYVAYKKGRKFASDQSGQLFAAASSAAIFFKYI